MRCFQPTQLLNLLRKRHLAVGGLAVAIAAGIAIAHNGNSPGPAKAPGAASAPVYELAQTDVVVVDARPLQSTMRLSGTLTPLRHAAIKSSTAGTLTELRVREGDYAAAGMVIARLDTKDLQAELAAKSAALNKARADLVLATKNRDNTLVLLNQKLVSQNSYDQAVATFAANEANEQAAQAQVQLAQNALDKATVRAEFSGVIASRSAQAGERVSPETPLVTLVDMSVMTLEAGIPVADVPQIHVGQHVRFQVDGFGTREFVGTVDRINPQTHNNSRSLTVYISVPNRDRVLRGGMFAQGEVVLASSSPTLAVPAAAIHREGTSAHVLTIVDGLVIKQPVELGDGFSDDQFIAIRTGLAPGTTVLVTRIDALTPGARAVLSTHASTTLSEARS